MPSILLPQETALRMQIALLQRDLAYMQARLLMTQADLHHQQTMAVLLEEAKLTVPVPLSACGLDVEHGCLLYEEPDGEVLMESSTP